jgi:hypothetical protein
VITVLQGRGQAAGITMLAEQAGTPELAASNLKAALDRDWDDPAARDEALARVLGLPDDYLTGALALVKCRVPPLFTDRPPCRTPSGTKSSGRCSPAWE